MPYSEKQIAEWADRTLMEIMNEGVNTSVLKFAVSDLIAAVRKETREECEKDGERNRLLLGEARNYLEGLELADRIDSALESEGWRACEFCGCNTNAKLRTCCNRGRAADAIRNLQEREEK